MDFSSKFFCSKLDGKLICCCIGVLIFESFVVYSQNVVWIPEAIGTKLLVHVHYTFTFIIGTIFPSIGTTFLGIFRSISNFHDKICSKTISWNSVYLSNSKHHTHIYTHNTLDSLICVVCCWNQMKFQVLEYLPQKCSICGILFSFFSAN